MTKSDNFTVNMQNNTEFQGYIQQQETWDSVYKKNRRLWKGTPYKVEGINNGDLVLEIGCGDGKTLRSPELRSCFLIALDYAPNALYRCRTNRSQGQDIEYVTGDAQSLPFPKESFSFIIAFHCLAHLTKEGRSRSADEIYRVLKNGGTFLFRDFSVEDMRFGKGEMVDENTFINKNGISTHFFVEHELLSLFERFPIKEIKKCNSNLIIMGKIHIRSDVEIRCIKTIGTW